MPQQITEILFYKKEDGTCPMKEWLAELEERNEKAYDKIVARLKFLSDLGREIDRPHVGFLEDNIWELRVKVRKVNYRLLFFFHGTKVAVVSHGFTKEKKVPPKEIETAVKRREAFLKDTKNHSIEWETEEI